MSRNKNNSEKWQNGAPKQDAESQSVPAAWRRLSRRSKAMVIAVVAVLAGWSTIKEQAVDPVWKAYSHRQPAFDSKILSSLRPELSFAEFQRELQASPVSVVNRHINVSTTDGKRLVLRNELFILDTAYVEAFVDDSEDVQAYTITSRSDGDQVKVAINGAAAVTLGKTRLSEAYPLDVRYVSSSCGAHIGSYFEIYVTGGVASYRTVAAGSTSAGAMSLSPRDSTTCAPPGIQRLRYASRADRDPYISGLYAAQFQKPSPRFSTGARKFREATVVNAVGVTGSGVEPFRQLISLHPDTLVRLDRDRFDK